MKDEEIAKIKLKSDYDENADDWIVPPFQLRAKEVTLPSLGKKNGFDMMEQEKENRELAIDGGAETSSDGSGGGDQDRRGGLFGGAGKGVRASQQRGDPFPSGGRRNADSNSVGVPQKRVQSRGRVQGMMAAAPQRGQGGGAGAASSAHMRYETGSVNTSTAMNVQGS